jgi:hypothetical protein
METERVRRLNLARWSCLHSKPGSYKPAELKRKFPRSSDCLRVSGWILAEGENLGTNRLQCAALPSSTTLYTALPWQALGVFWTNRGVEVRLHVT